MNKKNETMMREAGLNPALPHLIFSSKKGVITVSKRMCILLSTFEEKLIGLNAKKMMQLWPFANQEDAGPKLFSKLISEPAAKFEVQHSLQNFLLESYRIDDLTIVIVAKLQRKGDLLSDQRSRQELFRTLSHEIRTTSMSLEGYVNMLKDLEGNSDRSSNKMRGEVLERLREISKRLNKNVQLLDSLRDQLISEDEETKSVA
jgi:signal transduction histidine kinase